MIESAAKSKRRFSSLGMIALLALSSLASITLVVLPPEIQPAHAGSPFGIDVHGDGSSGANAASATITTTAANDVIVVFTGAEDAGSASSPTVTITDNL